MNQVITIDKVKGGNEIIIPSNNQLIYLKVLRDPKLKRTGGLNRRNQIPLYSSVLCSFKKVQKQYSNTWAGKSYLYTKNEYVCTPDEHNSKSRFDLNYKTLYLVKK